MTDTRELIERAKLLASRQYLHNTGEGIVFGYDAELIDAFLEQQAQEIESLKVLVDRYKSALTSLAISPTPSMKPQYWKAIASEALQEESHD